MMILKITYGKSTTKKEFGPNAILKDLVDTISTSFQINLHELDLIVGYPPKTLVGSLTDTLTSLKIVSNSVINVKKSLFRENIYNELIKLGYSKCNCDEIIFLISNNEISSAVQIISNQKYSSGTIFNNINNRDKNDLKVYRRVVDADNSCLFNSIYYLLNYESYIGNEQNDFDSTLYRSIISDVVLSNPVLYTKEFLDKTPDDYAVWINKPTSWGGEIELSILSNYLQIEIAVVNIQTSILLIYGEENNYNNRIYLVYDGIHYDALVYGINENKNISDISTFPSSDIDVGINMTIFGKTLKDQKKFINLAGCDLQCNICLQGLKGQKDAVEHAKATGHQNFGQVVHN